jgi:hypothetical protein
MDRSNHTYSFDCYSNAFLNRAQVLMKRFDEAEDATCLFYAALELRYGIESRLYEYIDAACNTLKVTSEEKKEYAATRLLRKLVQMIPDAEEPATVIVSVAGSKNGIGFRYTPVTRKLAQMHGRLGETLHITFFRRNPNWYYRDSLTEYGQQSLTDLRRFLGEVEKELAEATSGQLRGCPQFTSAVLQTLAEEDVQP